MKLSQLTLQQVKYIYKTHMVNDFPADERKPLRIIISSMKKGLYECLGAFEGDKIVAYALFIKNEQNYLIDYFAVIEGHRGNGIGSWFLDSIKDYYSEAQSIIIEVEDFDLAKNEQEKELQIRRYDFYKRNGYIDTGVRVKLFGVDFKIMELKLSSGHSEPEIKATYLMHYRSFLPGIILKKMVIIK